MLTRAAAAGRPASGRIPQGRGLIMEGGHYATKIGCQPTSVRAIPSPAFLDLRVRDEARRTSSLPNTMPVLQNYAEDVWIADGSERPLRLCFTSRPNDCRQVWRRIVVD